MGGRLAGKVAIITGAAQGIGRAYALRFATEGARVIVADRQLDKAESVAKEAIAAGGEAVGALVDVGDPKSVDAMVQTALTSFGRVDVLLNNAAIFSTITMRPFDQIPLDEWDQVLRVNLTGTFLCCRAVAPTMRSQNSGRIINVASSTVLFGRPNYLHYVSSKGGVIALTRALARELGDSNVTVNVILPGRTETEVPRATADPAQIAALVASQSIHKSLGPNDIVAIAVFLASDESALMSGQSLVVDGGHTFL